MKSQIKIMLVSISLFLTSCVKDIDFNQVNQFELNPVITASLVKFSFNQDKLKEATPNSGIVVKQDKASFTIFQGFKKRKNLKKIDLEIIIDNPFKRDFILNLSFVDNNGDTVYIHDILEIPLANTFNHLTTIVIASNPAIVNATEVLINLEMLPSTTGELIDPLLEKEFIFKSAGTFHYKIK